MLKYLWEIQTLTPSVSFCLSADAGVYVRQSFHHKHREDQMASTAIPSLGGYGVAELEPFESQERGIAHGHRKKYAIPKSKEREIIEKFKSHDQTELYNLLQDLKVALIRCAETLHYEASIPPAKQMGQTVLPEEFTQISSSRAAERIF